MHKRMLLILLLLLPHLVSAHMGGHDPVSEKEAIYIASQISEQFIDMDPGLGFGKLNKSWNVIPDENKRIFKKGNGYYIVGIENKREGKTLYILLSILGEVYDANFTGVFPDLK